MRTLVVIPTYNEAENIKTVLRRVRATLPEAEVLVVDDNSPDGTARVAASAGEELGGVTILHRPAKNGLGAAYRAGFSWGLDHGAEAMVEMDADLSHNPDDLPRLLAALENADLAIGSRYVTGGSLPSNWAPYRKALSKWANVYSAVLLGHGVCDSTAGFRAYRAELLRRLLSTKVRSDGYAFQIEGTHLARRFGARIAEVPIHFSDRTEGTSKMSMGIVVEALLLVAWWALRDRGLRLLATPMAPRRATGTGAKVWGQKAVGHGRGRAGGG